MSKTGNNKLTFLVIFKLTFLVKIILTILGGLRTFLEDGLIPMTNSLDERTIRPFTVGRNYVLNLFMCLRM